LTPVFWPDLDQYAEVRMPVPVEADGSPTETVLEELERLDERIDDDLSGRGLTVAIETQAGEHTRHLYVDAFTDAADELRDTLAHWPHGRVSVEQHADPGWAAVSHLRT
jgi:hypothetical protein